MWQCPNCGERVDADFDVCWHCGTARDGTRDADFQTEPDDPAVPDPGFEPPPPEELEDATAAAARRQRIVELCSAANAFEAQELCNILQEEGMQARVVGGSLANAGGGLVLGEPIAPRIWVRESDATRRRNFLARRFAESGRKCADWPESDPTPEWESPGEPEEDALPSDRRFRFLSQGFWIVGLACVFFGSVGAWQNGMILSEHSATASGLLVYRGHYSAYYKYTVGSVIYGADVKNRWYAPATVTIYYNPNNPSKHIVGSIAPPWVVLAFAFGFGAFLMFVGYQFR